MLISLDQLRATFVLGSKFKMYGHLKNKILTPACKEINDN
ncbi:MAG: RepB family plasmid replication initiator protein [Verrucomicrobia bacterium]|nr:RepB family plasmid replication initiator protein [Verrucomicrobiota bacterium]NCV15221.1 RepB family plasmid replication initiator protein [Betaproteobacteria bacterium]